MQNLIYNNINKNFTYNTLLFLLTQFWIDEILNKKFYSKIWLTIIVNNNKNKSFTLIKNLPIKISNFTYLLIALKQVFVTNIFNSSDILNTIVFKYHFEEDYKRDLYITNIILYLSIIFIGIIFIFCIFIIFIEVSWIYNIQDLDQNVLNYTSENIKIINFKEFKVNSTKQCIFSPLIELFNVTNVPSRFVDINLSDIPLIKHLFYNQDIISNPDISSNIIQKNLDADKRIKEYELLINDILMTKTK